jgi:hypothetical protein
MEANGPNGVPQGPRRDLGEDTEHGVHGLLDPLDPAQLENFMVNGSGLRAARPPLVPGATGEGFYRSIPFQGEHSSSPELHHGR